MPVKYVQTYNIKLGKQNESVFTLLTFHDTLPKS